MPDLTPFPGKVPTDKILLGEIPNEATSHMPFLGTSENTQPVLQTAALSADENQLAAGLVLATDQDGDPLTYSLTGNGADDALFTIDANSGALSFLTAPDFESPVDADVDGIYEVEVQVDDGNGATTTGPIQVTVQNANDAPVLQTTALSADENQTAAGLVLATDQDGDTLTYSLTGNGADAALFAIDANTGALSFLSAPDFEAPGDSDADGIYEVEVQIEDGNGGTATGLVQVTVQDINEEPVGGPDIDAFVGTAGLNQVLLNDGSGALTLASSPAFGATSTGVPLGDLDGDGDLDAFVANFNTSSQVWFNDGNGTFTLGSTVPNSADAHFAALGDFDGDNDLDAFVARDGVNLILLNDGSGNLVQTAALGSPSSWGVALGDLDGDGDLDAFVANTGSNQVFLNDGSGIFTLASTPPDGGGFDSRHVALGDLDGDGDLDAFIANSGAPNQVLFNDGSGAFTLAPTQPESGPIGSSEGAALGDLDGDGDLDVFVARAGAPDQVLLNDGSGVFTLAPTQPEGQAPSSFVALGDLDGDGDLDAFVTNQLSFESDRVLLNDGSGTFTLAPIQPDAPTVNSRVVALGDLDGDGGVTPVDEHGLPNINPDGLLPSMYVDTIV